MAPGSPSSSVGSVLFVCTYNMVRSPMAAGMFKHFHGHRVFVDSAGVRDGERVDPFAVSVMDELGIDIAGHRCKTLNDIDDFNIDLIITLSPEAHHRAMELTRTIACDVEYWNTLDPAGMTEGSREAMLESYRQVREYLYDRILERFPPRRGPSV